MSLKDYKTDTRPQRGGWAPGSYINNCAHCRCGFIGDKRASSCADCAYKATIWDEMTDAQKAEALDAIHEWKMGDPKA